MKKIEDKNEALAKMLKQKQTDAKEISEWKFKAEREKKLNMQLNVENEKLQIQLE